MLSDNWVLFNVFKFKGNDCVVMCQHDLTQNITKIEHYFNTDESKPNVLDPTDPTVGLTNAEISVSNGFLTCKFSRVKQNSQVKNYFDLHNNFYILGANGPISGGIGLIVFFLFTSINWL